MSKRGTYKYICEECKVENWLSIKDRNNSSIPRCVGCGSTYLEPSRGSKGPEKLSKAQSISKEFISTMDKKMNKK